MRIGFFLFVLIQVLKTSPTLLGDDTSSGVMVQWDYEDLESVPKDSFNANSMPTRRRWAVDFEDAVEGNSSLVFEYSFRKNGYFYPEFRLDREIPLGKGPVYLSGWLKVVRQHPEANHYLSLMANCCFPNKREGHKGFTVTTKDYKEMNDGWIYFYSGNIDEEARKYVADRAIPFEGAFVFAFSLRIRNVRPGEILTCRLDDVRLTSFNPRPAPDEYEWSRARTLYDQLAEEKEIMRGLDVPEAKIVLDGLKVVEMEEKTATTLDDDLYKTQFVNEIREIEPHYWRLKIIRLGESESGRR